MRRFLLILAASILLAGCQSSPPQAPLSAWVELAPGNTMQVRVITEAAACPALNVDGRQAAMGERSSPDKAFPVRACGLSVPRSTQSITLEGQTLPLLPAAIHRIVLFGDTGCRLTDKQVQLCNDPVAWPFALVARQAASKHPDLVIHLGDYHYREAPCPPGVAGCAGTPSGDNWDVWAKDFFDPAAPLLKVAPWVMVRGNHEMCWRAGKGWFKLLDPADAVPGCGDFTPAFAIHLDGFGFAMLDSAESDDDTPVPAQVREYAEAFKSVAAEMTEPFWLLTHRPIWALDPGKPGKHPLKLINRTEQAAVDPDIPANMDMAVSGHVHTFASYDFGPDRPPQLIVGVGGSLYDKMVIPAGSSVEVDGKMTLDAFAITQYGYLVMDRTDEGWDGTLYNAGDDRVLARCIFAARKVSCKPA